MDEEKPKYCHNIMQGYWHGM